MSRMLMGSEMGSGTRHRHGHGRGQRLRARSPRPRAARPRPRRSPPVRPMQHQPGGEPRRSGDLLAGAHQDAARGPVLARPQRKDDDVAGPAGDRAEQRIDAIGAMDQGDRAFGAHHRQRRTAPNRRDRPRLRSWPRALPDPAAGVGAAALDERRVGHDMVEGARRQPRRRPQQIADHHRDARLHAVEDRRCRRRAAPDRAAFRARRRGTCGTRAARHSVAAPVPQPISSTSSLRLGRHRGREKDRVDRDAIAVAGWRRRTRPPSSVSSVKSGCAALERSLARLAGRCRGAARARP